MEKKANRTHYIQNFALASFFLAIIGAAFVSTISLSPTGYTTNVVAQNDSGVLGASSEQVVIVPADETIAMESTDSYYLLTDQLNAPLVPDRYQKPLVKVTNASNKQVELEFSLKLDNELREQVNVGVQDQIGNVYSLNETSRIVTIPANTETVLSISYLVSSTINFNLSPELIIVPL